MKISKEQFYGLVFMMFSVIWLSNISMDNHKSAEFVITKKNIKKNSLAISLKKKNSIKKVKTRIKDSMPKCIDTNFKYVHSKFQKFNTNIDSAITRKFIEVMNFYNLDETQYMKQMYVGQILLESGAKQYRKNGDLVLSYAGAVGFCQIMPNTCRGYMEKYMDSTDIANFNMLGATDFSFAFSNEVSITKKNKMAHEWLTNVNNNIIMWGFITRNNLNRKGDIHKQLVSYNTGTVGMESYLSNGGDCRNHRYIKGIISKLSVASH